MKKSFLSKIDESIENSILEGNEEVVNNYLTSNGYALEEIEKLAEKYSKKELFLINGLINETNNDNLLERASLYLGEAISKNLDRPISYLKNLILTNKLKVQYRNLDNLTHENIKEIIKDQNLLEILEELDEK